MTEPRAGVSVFIRVRDEADALAQTLARVAAQAVERPLEVVVLDNESRDGSADVAARYGARVHVLPRHLFGYGRALNVGLRLCSNDYVVLLSAHAAPTTPQCFETLAQRLDADDGCAAVFCRQVPYRPVSMQEHRRFEKFATTPFTQTLDGLTAVIDAGDDAYEYCRFSNSACILRRDVGRRVLFRDLPYAEDRAFVVDVVANGWTTAYEPSVSVAYERPHTAKALYHVARRAQVSKHLVRELATIATGRQAQRSEVVQRVVKLLLKPVATALQVGLAPFVERAVTARAVRYAIASWGTTFGLLRGELAWRRHTHFIEVDAHAFRTALEAVRPYAIASEPATDR